MGAWLSVGNGMLISIGNLCSLASRVLARFEVIAATPTGINEKCFNIVTYSFLCFSVEIGFVNCLLLWGVVLKLSNRRVVALRVMYTEPGVF